MGYTHYFSNTKTIPLVQWNKLTKDVNKLMKHSNKNKVVAREYDDTNTPPVINENQISFNGIGDDGHETFFIKRKGGNNEFCKTARKPYDLIACVTLILYSNHVKGTEISSDGDLDDIEWQSAVSLANDLFGLKPKFTL